MKKEINQENIWQFKATNKLTTKDTLILLEAFRRKHFLNADAWMGLGTPTQYKSKYFRAFHNEIPKVNNWYLLTDEGETIMKKMEAFFKIPTAAKTRQLANEFLFSL